jgi:hypothetical protein
LLLQPLTSVLLSVQLETAQLLACYSVESNRVGL